MLKTQKVFWWRTGSANTEGKLGKEPDGEMGSRPKHILSAKTAQNFRFL